MTSLPQIHIFIVDDTPDDVQTYKTVLRRSQSEFNYVVSAYDYGQLALDALADGETPACILLDFNLPDMDGLQFMQKMADNKLTPIPVVMITGVGDEEVAVNALKLGASDYLMKTVDLFDRIHRSIQTAINASKLERAVAEQDQELRNFADVLAHDLRSPIANIHTYIGMITARHSEELPERVLDYLDTMERSGQHALDLIENLYNYTATGRTAVAFNSVDLNRIFNDIIVSLKSENETLNAGLTCETLPMVQGDGTALSQVFSNLIRNGLKFNTNEKPAIDVTCETHDGFHHLRFADNGIGVDPEIVEKIFEPLERAHGGQFKGSGLGLAICRKIARQHSGDISCQPSSGGGSIFLLTLPVAPVTKDS